MAELWPWLAVAGTGAAHGLSPANGWLLAAACGVHARDESHARRALGPIAFGQLASMTVLAWAIAQGLSVDRGRMRDLAVAMLVAAVLSSWLRRARQSPRIATPARHAGIALWSFLAASAQGAGLMLVPALVPLCASRALGSEVAVEGSLAFALAAVGVHTTAMLLTTGLLATGACRALGRLPGWRRPTAPTERCGRCEPARPAARPDRTRAPHGH